VGRLGVQIAPKELKDDLLETFDVLSEVIKDFCNGAQQKFLYEQMKLEAEEIGDLIKEILDFLFGQNIEESSDISEEDQTKVAEISQLESEVKISNETIMKLTNKINEQNQSTFSLTAQLNELKKNLDLATNENTHLKKI